MEGGQIFDDLDAASTGDIPPGELHLSPTADRGGVEQVEDMALIRRLDRKRETGGRWEIG